MPAIDIGSNAIRMLFEEVYERTEGVGFKKLTLVRLPVRLGEDAFVHGKISDKKAVSDHSNGAFIQLPLVYF